MTEYGDMITCVSRDISVLEAALANDSNEHTCTVETMTRIYCTLSNAGATVAQWLRCCATNRKVAGSIPAGVTGIFH